MIHTGLTRLLGGHGPTLGSRVGVVANPTAVDHNLQHLVDRLTGVEGCELRALFGPEHGIRGDAQDMVAVGGDVDSRTGLPVHSLYGADEGSLVPSAQALADIDTLVFDIQDVGARYYTYVWTLVLTMRVCATHSVRVIVLDRPNPLGGVQCEGGGVADDYRSFVGLCSVPNRHGLTVGELARWMVAREGIDVELIVVPMTGWRREMFYDECGIPWVLPSPNMPTLDTAVVYPGMCLIEGSELSEGRGTTRPFELVGAPYIDGYDLACALRQESLPGVSFRPVFFTPQFQKWAGELCGGVQLHVTERRSFLPYRTGVAILRHVRELYPDHFAWREKAYEFVSDRLAIDLLAGSTAVREGIDSGAAVADIAGTWSADARALAEERAAWFLY